MPRGRPRTSKTLFRLRQHPPLTAVSIYVSTPEDHARRHFLEEDATWRLHVCDELNRNRSTSEQPIPPVCYSGSTSFWPFFVNVVENRGSQVVDLEKLRK